MINIDKLYHWAAGFAIAVIVCFITPVAALLPVVVAAVGKEIYDYKRKGHTSDWEDAIATVNGGVFAVVVWLLLQQP